jgi:tRNA nucleotidyltransferase (CCA-adding enzyme)
MKFKRFLKRSPVIVENKVDEWESYVNDLPEMKAGVEILHKLEAMGGKAYIVGGAVRDIVLGAEEPNDVDIATNVPMEKIEKIFKTHDIGKNKDFGIVVIRHGGFDFEIAQFRKDGNYTDGRRPDKIEIVMDFEDDASRRDLTINALGVDKDGNIIDYFDGVKDIKNKIIRTVGDAHKRFGEDFLRMIRVPRFASRFGFKIDPKTLKAIQDNAGHIKEVAFERIYQELFKMAKQSGSKFADAIINLKDTGLLKEILPEVFEMSEFRSRHILLMIKDCIDILDMRKSQQNL